MQRGVGHDGLALLELHLHLREWRDVRPVGVAWVWLLVSCGLSGGEGWQARLHSLTKNGPVPALLTALAAHLSRQPIEFAVKTVRGRGGRVARPGRKEART